MLTLQFSYDKRQVLQALRYHFISRPEIRIMLILVNVFALSSASLFYFKKVTPLAFLIGSTLWFSLMICFWFILPGLVYRRAATFKDHFTMQFEEEKFSLGNERGGRSWPWKATPNRIWLCASRSISPAPLRVGAAHRRYARDWSGQCEKQPFP